MGNIPGQPPMNLTPPTGGGDLKSPINPPAPQEPVTTPIPGQPMESQGMPTGQIPGMPGQEMATPEQRQQLLDMMEGTQQKMSELETSKFRSANEQEVARVETLKSIFIMMQDAGVDLNDPASVAAFLDKLRQANPAAAQQLEDTLEDLLSNESPLDEQQMGQNPSEFNEGAPARGIPGEGMPMPAAPSPGPAQMPNLTPPTPQTGNETLPQDVRGPIPGQGGG